MNKHSQEKSSFAEKNDEPDYDNSDKEKKMFIKKIILRRKIYANGTNWIVKDAKVLRVQNRKVLRSAERSIKKPAGIKEFKGSEEAKGILRLDYFLLFSPPNQLEEMCTIKTRSLHDKDKTQLVQDELINFLSMRVLIARFEF